MRPATDSWTDAADAWDAHRDHVEAMKSPLTDALLAKLNLRPGQRVLELGAGTGALARLLAVAVGPGGQVIASDIAPRMVDLITRTTAPDDNVEVRRIDATAIDLPDSAVEAVVFRMGLMLVSDPAAVARQCRRVLAPRGRLAVAVWGEPADNPWLSSVGMAAAMHGLVDGPPTAPGRPFSLAPPGALQAALRAGGFTDISVTAIDTPATFPDDDAHLDTVLALAAPLAAALDAAPARTRQAVRATTTEIVAAYHTDKGLVLPGRALLALAS